MRSNESLRNDPATLERMVQMCLDAAETWGTIAAKAKESYDALQSLPRHSMIRGRSFQERSVELHSVYHDALEKAAWFKKISTDTDGSDCYISNMAAFSEEASLP